MNWVYLHELYILLLKLANGFGIVTPIVVVIIYLNKYFFVLGYLLFGDLTATLKIYNVTLTKTIFIYIIILFIISYVTCKNKEVSNI
jgi:hypothetical protein